MSNDTADALNNILEARENRASLRFQFSDEGFDTLSLSLNIAGYPKSNDHTSAFFNQIFSEVKNHLEANRVLILLDKIVKINDAAGDFIILPIHKNCSNLRAIKQITESFEENHALGRLIDIDIFDADAKPISSGKEKLCYFCNEHSAVYCMRKKSHTYTELREKIFSDIQAYNESIRKEQIIKRLSALATKALLYEVSLSPKPGLVDFTDAGSHSDMNYFSFLNSTSALSVYFREFCELGYNFEGDYEIILPEIRKIGLKSESAMFDATNGVNTQKGLIFLFGICLFTASKIISEKKSITESDFQELVKNIAKDIVKNELITPSGNKKTHGEKVFEKYGTVGAGVRYEVETGFQTIFNTALPFFKEYLILDVSKDQNKLQEILRIGLLKIMSENNDTNILYRSDVDVLNNIKNSAKIAIENVAEYEKLCEYCALKNISPGGSADLLAVSLLIHFIIDFR